MIQPSYSLFASARSAMTTERVRTKMGETKQNQPEADQRLVDFLRLTRDWTWEADAALKLTVVSRRAIDVIGHLRRPAWKPHARVHEREFPRCLFHRYR